MRGIVFGLVVAVLLPVAAAPAEAQAGDWWGWALAELVERRYDYDRYDRDDRDRYRYRDRDGGLDEAVIDIILGRRGDDRVYRRDDRVYRDDRRARGGGPPFCRSGRGHPVHGRQWCREKGWGYGGAVWDRRGGLGDIILRSPDRYRHGSVLDRRGLVDILGEAVLGRLIREARLDRRAPVHGRWMAPRGRTGVLQIRSGTRPVAELSDVDGDRRVDVVLVPDR